jgi:hypothetical protein
VTPAQEVTAVDARRRLRAVVLEAGGVVGHGHAAAAAQPRLETPFAAAEPVEGNQVTVVPVGEPLEGSRDAGFADGIQRFVVAGRIGLAPVLRAYVAAGVLARTDRVLAPAGHEAEEFIVAPLDRLPDAAVAGLHDTGLPVRDCGSGERDHPILDVQLAVQEIERRRRRAEVRVVTRFREEWPEAWVVVDGSLRAFGQSVRASRLIGVIKSHETQYLAGADLESALTLPEAHRTTAFRRVGDGAETVYSWYVRLWDWVGQDILFGLVRVERERSPAVLREMTEVSRWLLAERSPMSTPDARWDRLLYPIHEVENYLKARAGTWW